MRTGQEIELRCAFRGVSTFLAITALACGCAAPRQKAYSILPIAGSGDEHVSRAQHALANLFPSQYRATQRAILTVRKKQFVCDGVLTVAPDQGWHLAVVSTLGLVSEVHVTTNRTTEVLKITPLFRETWGREYVAGDLRRLFVPVASLAPEGRLPDGRLVLASRSETPTLITRYIFSRAGDRLEEQEIAGQGQRLWHARFRRYRAFPGWPAPVPAEFEILTPAYKLDLRTVELSVPRFSAAASPGGQP